MFNETLNAIVLYDYDEARKAAKLADKKYSLGESGKLLGLPITIKECINVKGMQITGGLPERQGIISELDSPVVSRLKSEGAIIVGKTNLPTFARDWQSNNLLYGRSNNPWDLDRTPGGSTGGGAAAVAAGLTPLDFGGDIIGSIRVPAAFCGVFGHKSSETLVSTSGHYPGSSFFNPALVMNSIGPLARSSNDLHLAINVIAGPDPCEEVAWNIAIPSPRHEKLEDYRVAILPQPNWLPLSNDVANAMDEVARIIAKYGTQVCEIQPEIFDDLRDIYKLNLSLLAAQTSFDISKAERNSIAQKMRVTGDEFDTAWADGLDADAQKYLALVGKRAVYRKSYQNFFESWDVLIAPITFGAAYSHIINTSIWTLPWSRKYLNIQGGKINYNLQGVYPGLANVSGQPATSFPFGYNDNGLPIGLQVIGPYLEDLTPIMFSNLLECELGGFKAPNNFCLK